VRSLPPSLAPFHHRGFRLLFAGQLTSNVGDLFYAVALPWYVLATHGGALLLGTVLAFYGIPRTVLLLVAGHAADRWRPWNVMMVADVVRALAVGALAVVAYAGPARAVTLIPVALLLGAGEGLFLPGSFAIVPTLLPGEEIAAGNALTFGGTQFATLLGPALGGIVVALVGPASAFVVDAASFAISAASLAGVRTLERRQVPAPAAEASAGGTADGAAPPLTLRHFLRTEPIMPLILGVVVAANLGFGGMSEVALPSLVHGPFHAGARSYGLLIAVVGGGALIGTLCASQIRRVRRPVLFAAWVFIVGGVFLSLTPYLGGTALAAMALGVFGLANGFGNIVTITVLQRWAPPAILGRLMGTIMLASIGIFPLSVFVGGVVVTHTGPAPFFPLAAGAMMLALVVGLGRRIFRDFGMALAEPGLDAGTGVRGELGNDDGFEGPALPISLVDPELDA
jgi:MFS family permease